VTFNPSKLGLPAWAGLPRPFAMQDAFLIPGMFTGYTTFNFDLFLEAERTPTGRLRDRGRFIALPLREHFPMRAAITYTQMFAAHHWDMLGPSGQRTAWSGYARQIKARHNRLHPDAPVGRVRFGVQTFPQSPLGYRAAKRSRNTWRYLWYAEP